MDIIMIYTFYLKHFSIWCIFNEIRGKYVLSLFTICNRYLC